MEKSGIITGPLNSKDASYDFQSLLDIVAQHAQSQGVNTAYIHWSDKQTRHPEISFCELHTRAITIATQLQQSLAMGSRVILAYPTGIDFIVAFMGCLYAGMIAVPVYPPFARTEWPRFEKIALDCSASMICTTAMRLEQLIAGCCTNAKLKHITCIATDQLTENRQLLWEKPLIQADDIAFLQYTSGTTGDPKGVMVSHGNIIANQAMISHVFQHTKESVVVGWLPVYHDMGLIGSVLNPLYTGFKAILMEPITFLRHPYRWLKVISEYAATTSGAPNFAYDYCINKIKNTEKQSLDLSSWSIAFNGSEKVQSATISNFSECFKECGFRKDSFLPCYGLAEATLFVSGKRANRQVQECEIDKKQWTNYRVKKPATPQSGLKLVNCGQGIYSSIRIVDPDTCKPCASERVGEIWVAGPHVAKGYYQKQRLSQHVFQARIQGEGDTVYLRTGDLGFFKDSGLYIAGRIKEMIIIRGRNYYPQDIEMSAQKNNPALRAGAGAAFGLEINNQEKVILVQEVNKKYIRQLDPQSVFASIRLNLTAALNLDIHEIILVRQGAIPLTTSGKIKRRLVKQNYLNNEVASTVHREIELGVEV